MIDVFAEESGQRAGLSLLPSFADGAAGTIHHVSQRSGTVAKLYKEKSACCSYEPKLRAMVGRPPNLPSVDVGGKRCVQIAWPETILVDAAGEFIGFLMPEVDFGASSMLENVMNAKNRRIAGIGEFFGYRILLAANLSSLMAELHEIGHYMVDMKPENLRFYQQEWSMAVLDTDGFSVQTPNGRVPADQYSDGYIAPEANGKTPEDLGEEQDKFALAVIIFRMLNNGIHPFQGKNRRNKPLPSTVQARIYEGLYAYGINSHPHAAPTQGSIHEYFEPDTRSIFDRAFQSSGPRPTAAEWRDHLRSLCDDSRLKRCTLKPQEHGHFSLGCGLCALEKLQATAKKAVSPVGAPIQQTAGIGASAAWPTSRGATPAQPGNPLIAPPTTGTARVLRSGLTTGRAKVAAGIATGVVAVWGLSQLFGGRSPSSPPYPIVRFATPLQEQVTSAKLNVRAGPGPSYQALKQAVQGDHITAFGSAKSSDGGAWQYVQLGDGSYGYVNARLVQLVSAGQPAPAAEPVTVAAAAPPPPPVTAPLPSPPTQTPSSPPPPTPVSIPEPSQSPPVNEASRVQQIITSADFHRDQSPDSGEIPGRSMVLRVDASYANAHQGDVVQGGLVQNGQLVARCNNIPLQESGTFWCRLPIFRPGNYAFLIGINGTQVLSHEFQIGGTSPQAMASPTPQQSTPPRNQAAANATRQLLGTLILPHH